MPFYESVFIARQDISTPQAEALGEAFTKIIVDNGGSVTKSEYWGLRTLAYRIKKNRKGHYTLFNIDAPAGAVQEMERQMGLHEDVLRCLTVRVDELEEGPSAMLQSRGDRGRGRRDGGGSSGGPRRDGGGGGGRFERGDRPERTEKTEPQPEASGDA